jgi:hypothetical protein
MSAADYLAKQGKRGNKFGAKRKSVDGIGFDSTHEADRYQALRLEEKAGEVRELKMQVPLQVEVNGQHVFTYLADFVYERKGVGTMNPDLIVWRKCYEDAKGYRKGSAYQLFRLKKAVIGAALGIVIEEV